MEPVFDVHDEKITIGCKIGMKSQAEQALLPIAIRSGNNSVRQIDEFSDSAVRVHNADKSRLFSNKCTFVSSMSDISDVGKRRCSVRCRYQSKFAWRHKQRQVYLIDHVVG